MLVNKNSILDGKVTLWVVKTDAKMLLSLRVMITECTKCYSHIWYIVLYSIVLFNRSSRIWYCTTMHTVYQ
jgi:hypothetical protein